MLKSKLMKTVMGRIILLLIVLLNGEALSQELSQSQGPEALTTQPYIGIIKNKTKYSLSIPSLNSGGTLIVPSKGWIEYIVYSPKFELDAYYNGKPIWCDNISVTPEKYEYMCKKYDFMAEIVQPEPTSKTSEGKYKKMKRAIKKPKPRPEGEQGAS